MHKMTLGKNGVPPSYQYTGCVKQLNGGGDVYFTENSLRKIAGKMNISETAARNILCNRGSRFRFMSIQRTPTEYFKQRFLEMDFHQSVKI